MIDAINTTSLASPVGAVGDKDKDNAGMFDAALLAAQRAEQRKQQHASEIDSIKSKGFTAWARDTRIEALKEKLRQQIMSEMGLDEDQLSHMSSAMRQILEAKIKEEIERRMQEELAKNQDDTKDGGKDAGGQTAQGSPSTQTAAAQQDGKKDQDGKSCPVIPALSWPGAASLF